jgi:glycosyltransferase involved in cell wall biosynthesis
MLTALTWPQETVKYELAVGVFMDLQEKKRFKVLFIASWYPNKEHPVSGIFIKRHAVAVSKYCEVAVLHVHLGSIDESIDVEEENGILVVRVYRKISTHPHRLRRDISNQSAQYLGNLQGASIGYDIICKKFGKPDLVHCNVLLYAGFVAFYLKLRYGIRYILTEHWAGYLEEDGTFKKRSSLGKAFIRSIGKNASAITTVSRKLRDAMIACGIENNYFVIPNVVDATKTNCGNNRDCKKQILHVSLLKDDIKNVSGIIEAIKDLSLRRDDFELHIVGSGPDRKGLENLSETYGLLNKMVFFEGMVQVDEVPRFFCKCDFFVLNSNFETFSVVTAEALSYGKPVIATRCGGPEEFVNDNCGILIEPRDKDGLVNAMGYMLDNYSSYNSKEIQEYAKNKFSSDAVGEEFSRLYQNVLKEINPCQN